MLEALSTTRNRTLTFVLLAICCASVIVALVVGISDNPPGIFFAFSAATAFILAFVHPWRTAKQFRLLLYASVFSLVIFGILHNVFEGVASTIEGAGLLQTLLQGLGVMAFLVAVLICPPAFLVGAIGSIIMFIRNRRRSTQGTDTVS
jgi:hypothetical protein